MGESKRLEVLIGGEVAGELTQARSGGLAFSYAKGYTGPDLSVSMPNTGETYGDKKVRPFFSGVLPEDPATLKKLGERFGISALNPFALLEHIGLDLPGALQVCPEQDVEKVRAREEKLDEVSEKWIGEKLRAVAAGQKSWISAKEHWSLGGAQSKFALRLRDGSWNVCEGSAATTHIFKPGIVDLNFQALDEFVCLGAARRLGLDVEEVSYEEFDGMPAIIARRYDRLDVGGRIERIHQEDFCQALSTLPEHKYTKDKGPGAYEIVGILMESGKDARDNVEGFIDALFYNYLIAGTDAHAKNYSLLHLGGRLILSPLYDIASYFPYAEGKWSKLNVAMPIGGEKRICRIGYDNLARFCEVAQLERIGLDAGMLADRLEWMAGELPAAMSAELEAGSRIRGMEELSERLMPSVEKSCDWSATRLSASRIAAPK